MLYRKILKALIKWFIRIHENSAALIVKLRHQLYFMDFEDRDSDIYVATYLKSGTTWMQVILYNMLTDGNMDFQHIYDVSPWPKNQSYQGEAPEKINNMPSPRILKSHDNYDEFNPGCKARFIYVYRDGKDVAVSLFHHNKNYLDPELTFDNTFEEFFTKEGALLNWFKFNNEWLRNKHNLNILYISYEQLTCDLDKTLTRIAQFLGVELNEEIIMRIKKHASFDYMKLHETKFGQVPPLEMKKVYNQFIRMGKTGEGNEYMNEHQQEYYEQKFKLFIEPYMNHF